MIVKTFPSESEQTLCAIITQKNSVVLDRQCTHPKKYMAQKVFLHARTYLTELTAKRPQCSATVLRLSRAISFILRSL